MSERAFEPPVIDMSPLCGGARGGARFDATLRALVDAATSWGVFFIDGHGIPNAELCELLDCARAFFSRSVALEGAVSRADGRGYMPAPALDDTTREFKESFTLMYPQPAQAWPADAATRGVFEAGFASFARLSDDLLRLLALALGHAEEHFLASSGRPASVLRIVNYPAPAGPLAATQRCETHTDYGTVSILLIDDAPGKLQLQTGPERWSTISVARGQLLVNLGDTMERWTQGRWRAPVHRVVNPHPSERATSQRLSVVFFHNPESIEAKVLDYLRT